MPKLPMHRHQAYHAHPTPAKPAKHKRRRSILSNIAILLIAPLAAILLTMFVFQTYQVDGSSMQNTLQNGDRLLVWKLPRTWARLTHHQYVPKRGDIVIVNQKDLTACGQEGKVIIKRVIGLPGDHVVYKNGMYTVYDAQHPTGFNPDTTLAYGRSGTALLSDPNGSNVDVMVSRTQLFISGDHRANSCDSRYFGPINTNQIIGKLVFRIFPFSDTKRF